MSGFQPRETRRGAANQFRLAASPVSEKARRQTRGKRVAPLSIRLSPAQRADLEARAGDLPISAYAKSLLFATTAKPTRLSPRNPSLDHQILGQLLAWLGRSEIAAHLQELAEASRSGSLPVDDLTTEQLQTACENVQAMRDALMVGLGCGR